MDRRMNLRAEGVRFAISRARTEDRQSIASIQKTGTRTSSGHWRGPLIAELLTNCSGNDQVVSIAI